MSDTLPDTQTLEDAYVAGFNSYLGIVARARLATASGDLSDIEQAAFDSSAKRMADELDQLDGAIRVKAFLTEHAVRMDCLKAEELMATRTARLRILEIQEVEARIARGGK